MSPRPRSPERPYAAFRVLDLTKDSDRAALREIVLPSNPNSLASESLLDHIFGEGGEADPLAKTAVVESEYVDRDHSRAHYAFFTRAFADIPRKATRIHFFSERFTIRALRNLSRFQDSYLGFTVVRPLRVRKAGRSVLPIAGKPGDNSFITTPVSTQVNLAGFQLDAKGPPYIEQDERVSRCATVGLWMASTALADRVGSARFSTAEITQLATRFVVGERALPSAGLMPQQMAEALRAMGFDPVNVGFSNKESAWSALYSYVESGIPPLLLFRHATGQHVLTAVGHTWAKNSVPAPQTVDWVNEPALTFHRSSSWVPSLIAHDDENGPYVNVFLMEPAAGKAELTRQYGQPTAERLLQNGGIPLVVEKHIRHSGEHIHYAGVLLQILVPNPQGVTLTPAEAERKAARLIRTWFEIRGEPVPDNFALRTYLARSNDLKVSIRDSTMHAGARQIYQSKGMPRWLWVTEISSVDELNIDIAENQRISGEVVIDATSSPWTADFLVFHLQQGGDGYIHTMLPKDRDAESAMSIGWRLPEEMPYKHLAVHPRFP